MKRLALCLLLAACRAASAAPPADEIGSLRNARVALPRADRATVTYFAGELDGERLREATKLAPNVRIVAGLSREEALARAGEAHGIDARYATPELLRAAKKLVWVQAQSAGVDRYLSIPE